MEELTKDQEGFLGILLEAYPDARTFGPGLAPRVREVAIPLVEQGWVTCLDDELAHGEALSEGTVAYRLKETMVEPLRRAAAEKAKGWRDRHQILPTGDARCDVCAGNRDRPKPKPGERWSVREVVHRMCEACFDDFRRDLWVAGTFLDPVHRKVEPPPNPSEN